LAITCAYTTGANDELGVPPSADALAAVFALAALLAELACDTLAPPMAPSACPLTALAPFEPVPALLSIALSVIVTGVNCPP
jgi:hypothetical protein